MVAAGLALTVSVGAGFARAQVLYGTDFPFWDGRKVNEGLAKGGFTPSERMAVDRDNALRLFPRLKG